MERYKSIVKSVTISGARHAYLLSDGQTWLSVFLRKDQKPEFQQAIRNVAAGHEYIFDCIRNERNFLNITAIQHPSWPAPIQSKDVQAGAPTQATTALPPMPGPVAVPSVPQATVQQLAPEAIAPSPTPVPLPPAGSPATVNVGPSAGDQGGDEGATGSRELQPLEIKEPTEVSMREKLIARENAASTAANLLCAIIEKGALPDDVESFITWAGVKFVQLQDVIAANTLKINNEDDIPF